MESALEYIHLRRPSRKNGSRSMKRSAFNLRRTITDVRVFASRMKGYTRCFYVVVENQIALGDQIPVQSTLQRLMAEGLDRHEAIHAIASVLAEFMHDLVNNPGSNTESNRAYFAALQRLTAEGWLEP